MCVLYEYCYNSLLKTKHVNILPSIRLFKDTLKNNLLSVLLVVVKAEFVVQPFVIAGYVYI